MSLCLSTWSFTHEASHEYTVCYTFYLHMHMHVSTCSDTSSIDHLVMRKFVSGPRRYHKLNKGVREQFVILNQNTVSFVPSRVLTTKNEIAVFNVYFLDLELVHSVRGSA